MYNLQMFKQLLRACNLRGARWMVPLIVTHSTSHECVCVLCVQVGPDCKVIG